jgi:hypothetical protein
MVRFLGALLGVTGGSLRRRSSNMAATVAILDLVSVDYLTNACVDWSDIFVAHWGVINLHHIPLLPKPYLPYTDRQLPTQDRGICHALRSPCFNKCLQPLYSQNRVITEEFTSIINSAFTNENMIHVDNALEFQGSKVCVGNCICKSKWSTTKDLGVYNQFW